MPLLRFLRQLFDHGRVTVEQKANPGVDPTALNDLLLELEAAYRRQLPGEMPGLNLEAAGYGAATLYRAAQLLTFRELGEEDIARALHGGPAPGQGSDSAAEQYSVDLCLHFLSDLMRLARAASADDPLIGRLLALGGCWPLSSVGMKEMELNDLSKRRIAELAKHPALWRLYVDRVMLTGDASRLADERTRAAVQAAVGAYPQLAGKLSEALKVERIPAA
jgi:hypothetical protein